MSQRELVVRFVTPAFLGGADQSSEWRTPPFKALLRQWWRVWTASVQGTNAHQALRELEGVVFGHAALKHNGRAWHVKSPVRLRLRNTRSSPLNEWRPIGEVLHPEVTRPANKMIGADLYLGYGPLLHQRGTRIKAPPALAPGARAEILLWYPETLQLDEFSTADVHASLDGALRLAHLFGCLGARSRNGWGSLELLENGAPLVRPEEERAFVERLARPLEDCLQLEWPHAIGKDDEGVLVWKTRRSHDDWAGAMRELASVKIAFRTQLPAGAGGAFAERHLLAYPVTNHTVGRWGSSARLANQLRFKVRRDADGRYRGWAFHLPCRVPEALRRKLHDADRGGLAALEKAVWPKVHAVLGREMQRAFG